MTRATAPLVSSKLRPSRARSELVARPRLTEKLNPEAGRSLTLISAPAGFGKTTLLNRWSTSRAGEGNCVAWLSLDGGDNDPARFLTYLVAALRKAAGEGFGEGIPAALRSPGPPRIEALTGALVNEMADLPGGLDLILDDYHLIDSEGVHGVVSFLLEHPPEDAHLVISSRADPPLPLPRLRARDQMSEIGAAELAFTPEEATAFLKGVMGLDLSAEDVATLEEITEGWIAGLQLAALSMRDREDVTGFVRAFSGSHRDVLDFLAEEVLERQPDRVREFLLKTSILDGLSGPLCDALTGRDDGQRTLEHLERENLFVVALDDERRWYRYHHLFAGFLRERLGRIDPAARTKLHRRAALWHEGNGSRNEAIKNFLAARDFGRAAGLIEREDGGRRGNADASAVISWRRALPDGLVRGRPRLCLIFAWALVDSGGLGEAEGLLGAVEAASKPEGGPATRDLSGAERTMLGEACVVRARIAAIREDAALTVRLCGRALDLLPESEPRLRGEAALDLGLAHGSVGNLDASSEALSAAAACAGSAADLRTVLYATRFRATLEVARGRLREAEGLLREGQRLAEGLDEEAPPVTGTLLTGMGELLYERGELDEARRLLEEGIEHGGRSGDPTALVYGHVNLARIRMAQGDAEGARALIRRAGELSSGYPLVGAWRARFDLMEDEVASAARWAREYRATEDYAGNPRHLERITISRVLLAEGKTDEAMADLGALLKDARAEGRILHEVEILVLLALTSERHGETDEAVAHLRRALSVAEPEDLVRVFVDEGPPMAALLARLTRGPRHGPRHGPSRGYASRLLESFAAQARLYDGGSGERAPRRGPGAVLEPLTGRETEVLELVASGLSNAEIAAELYLSVGTVKAHLHRVFGKLFVHNRSQAVARARELRLFGRTSSV